MLRNCWANFAPFSGLGCSWQRVGDDECFVSSFIGIAHLPMSPASSRTPWWRDPPNLVSERTQATLHQQSQAFYLADHVSGMGPGMGPEGTQEETCLGNAWEKSDLHANKNGAPKILFYFCHESTPHPAAISYQITGLRSWRQGVATKAPISSKLMARITILCRSMAYRAYILLV